MQLAHLKFEYLTNTSVPLDHLDDKHKNARNVDGNADDRAEIGKNRLYTTASGIPSLNSLLKSRGLMIRIALSRQVYFHTIF